MLKPILLALMLATATSCSPPDPKLSVKEGWARATGASDAAAAYFTIQNAGGAGKLTGVRSSIGRAMLHETSLENGVMRMRPIDPAEGLIIPSNGRLLLAPGGAHVMITGLEKPLEPGDRFDVTLQFDKARPKKVAINVQPAAAAAPGH